MDIKEIWYKKGPAYNSSEFNFGYYLSNIDPALHEVVPVLN